MNDSIAELKEIAENRMGKICMPEQVKYKRAYYEGMIACFETDNWYALTENPYKEKEIKSSLFFQRKSSWFFGWLDAVPIIEERISEEENRMEQFPFLKEIR